MKVEADFIKILNRVEDALYALDVSDPTSIKELNEARKVLEAWRENELRISGCC